MVAVSLAGLCIAHDCGWQPFWLKEIRTKIGAALLGHLVLSVAIVHGLKAGLSRARPHKVLENPELYSHWYQLNSSMSGWNSQGSFPSGHVASTFLFVILADLISSRNPKCSFGIKAASWCSAFGLVSLMAAARILGKDHWPTDVWASIGLGALSWSLIRRLAFEDSSSSQHKSFGLAPVASRSRFFEFKAILLAVALGQVLNVSLWAFRSIDDFEGLRRGPKTIAVPSLPTRLSEKHFFRHEPLSNESEGLANMATAVATRADRFGQWSGSVLVGCRRVGEPISVKLYFDLELMLELQEPCKKEFTRIEFRNRKLTHEKLSSGIRSHHPFPTSDADSNLQKPMQVLLVFGENTETSQYSDLSLSVGHRDQVPRPSASKKRERH